MKFKLLSWIATVVIIRDCTGDAAVARGIVDQYLEERDCVHFQNTVSANQYGVIDPAICKSENGFDFPRIIGSIIHSNFYNYECCKTKEGGSTPFIKDYLFKITVYPQIAISAIAVILSMVLIIALLIPLLGNLIKQSTNSSAGAIISTNARAPRAATATATEPAYSCYNFYLVYFAIPDLILSLYLLIIYGGYSNQKKINPNLCGNIMNTACYGSYFENALIAACSTANLVRTMLLL
jgi:hypothetical protein